MKFTLVPTIKSLLEARKLAGEEARELVHGNEVVYATNPPQAATVIIIAYHSGRILFDAIERVLSEKLVKQLIIIDNGSSDRAVELLRAISETHEKVLLVHGHGNIGFARAANMGAQIAGQPWLVFLNPDAILRDGAIEALINATLGAPKPCLVGARVLNPDGTEQRGSRRGEVTPVTTLVSLLRLQRYFPFLRRYEIHREQEPLPSAPIPVAAVSGACFCIEREDFLSIGGFDTRFFLHVEDIDLCWRVRKTGGTVLFHPHAEVIHEGHTSRVEPVFVELNKGFGLVYYFRKRADTLWRKIYVLALAPIIVLVSVLRALIRPKLRDNDEYS